MASEFDTRRYVVTGRVQGVGFRYFVQRKALELGVRGWVRNRPDGSVEAVAGGGPEAMRDFELALRKGPPLSRVDHVADQPAPAFEGEGFRITV
ncbi:MAG: acylphosphatase [Bryobacterales bacterium]|nr:acylphosphatase [Bryobacterales bacterium]